MSMHRLLRGAVKAGVYALCLFGAASPAAAATFSVNPTQIFLARDVKSALLTVRNDSADVVRFQITAFGWNQTESGDISLSPTSDVVFFPALIALNPQESRQIRVGAVTATAATEKTYRIFVEELPSATAATEGGVRVLTKMGIPIFVRPAKETATATLQDLRAAGGVMRFDVANSGTVHFVPQRARLRGIGGGGKEMFEQEFSAWYILAGGHRAFEVPLPAGDCTQVSSVVVEFGIGTTSLSETLQTPGGVCAP